MDPVLLDPDDYHRWERPARPDCPRCQCCTAHLCATAARRELPCSTIGTPGDLSLDDCPCAALAAAHRMLSRVPDLDPSHPDNAGRWDPAAEVERYNQRNGTLIGAVRHLVRAGVPVGVTRDPADPHPVILTIELPGAGQVSWHMPDRVDDYRLPPAAPWDGHDTPAKYARLAAWLTAADPLALFATAD